MSTSLRAPLVAVGVALALVLLAYLLDLGSGAVRDAALPVFSLAVHVLLPLALVWLVVALVRDRRR